MAVAVGRHVDRHAGDGRGEVGAVVEVEPAQVVLVGLSLAAVLADDQPGYGLEHLGRAHHRAGVELTGGDRALAGRLGDPDQVLRRPLDVGEVGEGGLAGHGDVGGERQAHHHVGGDRAGGRHDDVAPAGGEVHEQETEPGRARWHAVEAESAAGIAVDAARGAIGRRQLDHHARQPGAASSMIDPATCAGCAHPSAAQTRTRSADRPTAPINVVFIPGCTSLTRVFSLNANGLIYAGTTEADVRQIAAG